MYGPPPPQAMGPYPGAPGYYPPPPGYYANQTMAQ